MSKIYILVDPVTNHVRYVGKTSKSLNERLRGHIEKSRNLKNKWHVAQWIRSLTSEGLAPIIELIREVEEQYVNETEIFCIEEYKRLGCDLTNNTSGGDGGVTGTYIHSAESMRKRIEGRRKSGSSLKGTKQSPEFVARRLAGFTPEKHKAKAEKAKKYRQRNRELAIVFDGYDPYKNGVWISGKLFTADDFTPERKPRERIVRVKEPADPEVTKEKIRQAVAKQWESIDEETKAQRIETFKANADEFRRKIRDGEIEDPRLGFIPWNKGKQIGPETITKVWEAKRAAGYTTQAEMCQDLADRCGHSRAKVERALKGYAEKVAQDTVQEIWEFYEAHKEDYPKLTVKDTDRYIRT